MTLYLQ